MREPSSDPWTAQWRQRKALASRFNNPAASPDLTIVCNGRMWLCHRMVLGMQSEYFQAMWAGRSKEATASEVELVDDDPDALEAALRFCYTLELPEPEQDYKYEWNMALFFVRIFILAEKYFITDLATTAADRFVEIITPNEIPGKHLSEAFKEAYTNTTDSGRLLRKAITNKVLDDDMHGLISLGSDIFDGLGKAFPEFWTDMQGDDWENPDGDEEEQKDLERSGKSYNGYWWSGGRYIVHRE